MEGKRGAAREHRSLFAGVAKDPLTRGSQKALRMRYFAWQGLGRRGLNRWRTEALLGVWRGGVVTRSGLMIGWAMMGTQGGDKGVGRAVAPVWMGVHGGESELADNVQTVFIPARLYFHFHFPSSNIGFEQNKPKCWLIRFTPSLRSWPSLLIPICPSLPCPAGSTIISSVRCARRASHTSSQAEPAQPVSSAAQTKRENSQGVVSICSPVNTAFAPAMKHIICSGSPRVCRPAARRIIVLGRTIRAVAIVRSTVGNGTG